jgi:predicted SAM-dependent methyltransferase
MKNRKEIVLRHVDRQGQGIEIGPCHNPIAPKREGFRVHIIDHMSRPQLLEKYKHDHLAVENIEEVDFVWGGQPYAELVGRTGCYDWIIASHVIEHSPDFIAFLNDCDALLKDGGVLCLVVPDKRFCFDRFRPVTGLAKFIDSHYAGNRIHTPGTVAEFLINVVTKAGERAWDETTRGPYAFIHSAGEAAGAMAIARDQKAYLDVHNWCFVPHSFRLILEDLNALGFTKLREVDFSPTEACEFYVTLGRHGRGPGIGRMEMLRAIESETAAVDAELAPPPAPAPRRWWPWPQR